MVLVGSTKLLGIQHWISTMLPEVPIPSIPWAFTNNLQEQQNL